MTKYFTKEGDDFKEVDDDLFTQQEVDGVVKTRAERVARQQFGDYDELKEKAGKVDSIKTEYETKLTEVSGKITDLEKQVGKAKLETEKVKIVTEFKLPKELHEFVAGETADEMRQRAEKLSKGVKPEKVVIDKKGKPDGEKSTDNKVVAGKLFGRGKSD